MKIFDNFNPARFCNHNGKDLFHIFNRKAYTAIAIIFSNTIKDRTTLSKIKQYKPLVTYDNIAEVKKLKEYCDTAGLVLRLKVPDTGSQVEMVRREIEQRHDQPGGDG